MSDILKDETINIITGDKQAPRKRPHDRKMDGRHERWCARGLHFEEIGKFDLKFSKIEGLKPVYQSYCRDCYRKYLTRKRKARP